MPGGDQTGPNGGGPKTGRGLGICAGNDQPGYTSNQPGQGFGMGFGWGRGGRGRRGRFNAGYGQRRGRGRFYAAPMTDDPEISALKSQNQDLHQILQEIRDRLEKLES